jgi:cell division transport system permease protein
MQLRYVFSELRHGLRRNLSMHVAVILTIFVSLTLVGIGSLLNMQANKTADHLGSQLEVIVWLCTPEDPSNNACTGEVTEPQKGLIEKAIEDSPEVDDFHYESKEVAFEKAKELYPDLDFEGDDAAMTADDMPQSYWVTLKNPEEADGLTSAVQGLDGVSFVGDVRDELKPVYTIIDVLKYGSWIAAGTLVLAALLLVANTIRLAALARRKEIGIMRLVGASTLYIALPFLLEALVTAAVGVVFAAGALAAFVQFGITDGLADLIDFLPWIGWDEYVDSLIGYLPPGIVILGPVLTVVPTLLLTRKYIKV